MYQLEYKPTPSAMYGFGDHFPAGLLRVCTEARLVAVGLRIARVGIGPLGDNETKAARRETGVVVRHRFGRYAIVSGARAGHWCDDIPVRESEILEHTGA
jgi:hypothetical protein